MYSDVGISPVLIGPPPPVPHTAVATEDSTTTSPLSMLEKCYVTDMRITSCFHTYLICHVMMYRSRDYDARTLSRRRWAWLRPTATSIYGAERHLLSVGYFSLLPERPFNAKMLAALTLVPLQDVVKTLEELVDYLPKSILSVVDYFEDNFIGRLMRRTRRTPKFQPKLWNLYEAAIHGLASTNNGLEG